MLNQDKTTIEVQTKPATEKKKAESKKYDLAKVFITFTKQFSDIDKLDMNLTRNQLLHKVHIHYIQKHRMNKQICLGCVISADRICIAPIVIEVC